MLKPKVIVIYDQTFTKGVFFVTVLCLIVILSIESLTK